MPVKPFKATCKGDKLKIQHVEAIGTWCHLVIEISSTRLGGFFDLDTRKLRRLQKWLNDEVFRGEE